MGALIFAPLINHLILSYGWRNAFLYVGIIFFIIITVSSLAIKRSPIDARTVSEGEESMPKSVSTEGWAVSKVVATPSFISITLILCVAVVAFQTLSVHLVPYAGDVGISATASAAALGLMGDSQFPGALYLVLCQTKLVGKRRWP